MNHSGIELTLEFCLPANQDVNPILEMMREFYAGEEIQFHPEVQREALLQLITDRNLGQARLVKYAGVQVGYFVICFGFSLEYGGRDAFLDEIFLQKNYRSLGIGRQCMEEIERLCIDHQVKTLHLQVFHKNPRAKKFYKGIGFEEQNRYFFSKNMHSKRS